MKTFASFRKTAAIYMAALLVTSFGCYGLRAQGTVRFNQAPVVRVRVLDEFTLPILHRTPPSHLDDFQYLFPGYSNYWHYVLVPGTNVTPFVVDVSGTTDPDSNPLSYSWSYYIGNDEGDRYPLTSSGGPSSPYFTNHPPYFNSSKMIVEVTDGATTKLVWFGVQVVTPQALTDTMWDWLQERYDNRRGPVRRRLIPTLQNVSAKFAAGDTAAAREELRRFQRQVRSYGHYHQPAVTQLMLQYSQFLLDKTNEAN